MADVDICNRALAEIGTRSTIASLSESSAEAYYCGLFYNQLRKALLRTAPWGFARKALVLTEVGNYTDGTSQLPWAYNYRYPPDCIKLRYVTPSQLGVDQSGDPVLWLPGFGAPSRNNRFLVDTTSGERQIVSNVQAATAIYTWDVENTDLFDPLFEEAFVKALGAKLCMVLTGAVQLKASFEQLARDNVMQARAVDGNEAVPSQNDYLPDWIAARQNGLVSLTGQGYTQWGQWYCSWDALPWGE